MALYREKKNKKLNPSEHHHRQQRQRQRKQKKKKHEHFTPLFYWLVVVEFSFVQKNYFLTKSFEHLSTHTHTYG